MRCIAFPVIDPVATGENIQRLRRDRGLTVRDLQMFFGFEEPQAIYKWQRGKSLPSVDNLYALSALLGVPMDDIIVSKTIQLNQYKAEQQATACCSAFCCLGTHKGDRFVLRRGIHHAAHSGDKSLVEVMCSCDSERKLLLLLFRRQLLKIRIIINI